MDNKEHSKESKQEAPFLELKNGLDPKTDYTQKFHYAPADLYPRHYKIEK